MDMKHTLFIIALCFNASLTAQEVGVWYHSSGPGTQANYAIEAADGTQLNIICKDAEPVTMYATVKGKDYGTDLPEFKLMVDGNEYMSPPYHLTEFDEFWNALRQAQVLYIATRQGLREIPTEGLIDALPASNSPDYNCYTQPKRTADANNIHIADKEQSVDIDRLAVEATTADMSQTQLEAGTLPTTDEALTWYEQAWHAVTERIERMCRKLRRLVREVTRVFAA